MLNTECNAEITPIDFSKDKFFEHIRKATKFFRLVSCKKRLLIISALIEKPMTVTEIQSIIKLSQPSTSNHLKILHSVGIVCFNKKGRTVYYQIDKKKFDAVINCLKNCKLS